MTQMPEFDKTLSVSQVTGYIQHVLEEDFSSVWVRGEISNLTKHSSGHWYFSLKDQGAQLSAVMFRRQNQTVRFELTHGMDVTVHGRISVYPPQGRYQLIVDQMQAAGQGDLHVAFEALKKRLQLEGLFHPDRKRALPLFPEKIGIVTSPTGAAIRDMIHILGRRFPLAQVTLFPVRVQGSDAAAEIVQAITKFNEGGECDVLIVGRGGGSLEDLWAFNEEIVARAIADSTIPVVSAVGHETDTTISDYVADRRAPTPSAAAELVVPDQRDLRIRLSEIEHTLQTRILNQVRRHEQRLDAIQTSYALKRPLLMLEQLSQKLDYLQDKSLGLTSEKINLLESKLTGLEQQITALNPLAILERGYAVLSQPNGTVIQSVQDVDMGDKLKVRVVDGELSTTIDAIESDY